MEKMWVFPVLHTSGTHLVGSVVLLGLAGVVEQGLQPQPKAIPGFC